MTKIILSGINGHMGQVIVNLAQGMEDITIVCGFDINAEEKNGIPVFASPKEFTGEADVIVDFSHPSAFDNLLDYAKDRHIPIVVCTTGLTQEQRDKLSAARETLPVFFSANMSVGVNLLMDLVKKAASVLSPDFDIEIVEKHHNQKIDAPSGTALAIADTIAEATPFDAEYTFDRHSVRKKRAKEEIGIHAVRGGTIVGEHTVIFAGCDEIIEVKHTAMSKEIFAAGALRAARFMVGKENGMYSMKDVIEG